MIPDTQVKVGVNTDHLEAAGHYIVEKQPEVIVHIGDHWDMASLSSFDRPGSKKIEGKRYLEDIEAGNDAMDRLMKPLQRYNRQQVANRKKQYKPHLVFCMGNHENRINRATEADARIDGLMTTEQFNLREHGWDVRQFLEVANLDGVNYSHYFVNPAGLTGHPIAGTNDNKLSHLG